MFFFGNSVNEVKAKIRRRVFTKDVKCIRDMVLGNFQRIFRSAISANFKVSIARNCVPKFMKKKEEAEAEAEVEEEKQHRTDWNREKESISIYLKKKNKKKCTYVDGFSSQRYICFYIK